MKLKNALSAYFCFLKEQREQVAELFPDGNVLMRELVKQGEMSEIEKQPYRIMQDLDRLRYEIELKQMNRIPTTDAEIGKLRERMD